MFRDLIGGPGFRGVAVETKTWKLSVSAPKDFLWQYANSTPLAGARQQMDDDRLAALERDVVAGWEEFIEDDALVFEPNVVVAVARRQ